MRKSYSLLLATLLVGLFFAGCKEKPVTTPGDLENPTITMTSPVELPVGQFIPISSSDSFFIDIRFEDDKELRDWEITIRFMPELNYLRTTSAAWKETWFGSLDGVVGGVNTKEYVIYDPTAGPYEFMVRVTDAEGKSTTKKTYFFVKNKIDLVSPTVTFTAPDTMNVDTFVIGAQLPIVARCEEVGDPIRDVYVRVRDVLTKEILEGSEIRYDTVYATPYDIDTFVTIPAGTVPGNYNVEIYANDQLFNVGYGKCEVYIKPN
jgi:hypothetical protein